MALRAIVLDPATRSLKFTKVKKAEATKAGTIIETAGGAAIVQEQVWLLARRFRPHKKYVMLKEGDPRPLKLSVNPGGLEPDSYDAKIFKAAITTRIATKFMDPEMDWKLIVIAILGLVALGLVATIYSITTR